MTTETTQELDERVAKALGWIPNLLFAPWQDEQGKLHANPSDPAEVFKLCAEFNVWPVYDDYFRLIGVSGHLDTAVPVIDDNTPSGRLEAATRAVLLAVIAIKEQT
jgi:hypothetical protein